MTRGGAHVSFLTSELNVTPSVLFRPCFFFWFGVGCAQLAMRDAAAACSDARRATVGAGGGDGELLACSHYACGRLEVLER